MAALISGFSGFVLLQWEEVGAGWPSLFRSQYRYVVGNAVYEAALDFSILFFDAISGKKS